MSEKKKVNAFKKFTESRIFNQILPIVFLVVLCVVFGSMTNGRFTKLTSLKIILDQALIVGTVAIGGSFIFATGNTSLSMGATTLLTATIACVIYNATGSVALMVVSAIAIGVILMVFSALLSTLLNVRVLYVTVVMMALFAAIQQSILGGGTIAVPFDLVNSLTQSNFHYIAFAIYFVAAIVIFNFTEVGRALKLIGTNKVCADMTGISYKKYLLIAFILGGIGCGVGALIAIIRAGSISTTSLSSLNMDVMLALVLGGMSIFGGSKSFVYAGVVGSITVVALNQGLLMIGVDASYIQAIRGIVFLILVVTSQERPKGLPAPEG